MTSRGKTLPLARQNWCVRARVFNQILLVYMFKLLIFLYFFQNIIIGTGIEKIGLDKSDFSILKQKSEMTHESRFK